MKIYTETGGPAVIILQPECYADRLMITKLKQDAEAQKIDYHAWDNENGKGLTFFLKAER